MKRIIMGLLLTTAAAQAQEVTPLTVEKIMKDQKWLGTSPSNFRWSADSKKIYFDWNRVYSTVLNELKYFNALFHARTGHLDRRNHSCWQ